MADLITGGAPNVHHIRWMRTMTNFIMECYQTAGDYRVDGRLQIYEAQTNKDIEEQARHVLAVFDILEKLVEQRDSARRADLNERESDLDIINRMFPIPD